MLIGLKYLSRQMDNGNVILFRTCSVTGERYTITLTIKQFTDLYNPNRPPIQDLLPDLDTDQREFLITGLTPAEFNNTFKDE